MRLKMVFALVVLVLIIPGIGAAGEGPDLETNHLIGTETYDITYELNEGEEFLDTVTEGPIEVTSENEGDNQVTVEIRANDISERANASLTVQTSETNDRINFQVFPNPDQSTGGDIEGVEQKAQQYEELQDQWVNQRVNRKETDDGTLIVYEQRDPTKGSIDSETGLPKGEWVEVNVDGNGDPKWLYDSPQGALAYQANKANTRYGDRTKWFGIAVAIPIISLLVQWVGLPLWRRKKEEKFIFGDG